LKHIILTPKAKDLAFKVKKGVNHAEAELATGLSQEEVDAFFCNR
jgi:DNA-binding MarR family transcriptional regulator